MNGRSLLAVVLACASCTGGGSATTAAPPPAPKSPELGVEAQIAAALGAQKRAFVDRCWAPLIAKTPQPATSTFDVSIAVNPEGHEVMRAIGERQREPSRADVAECLRGIRAPITIAPPGRYVSVVITIAFSS